MKKSRVLFLGNMGLLLSGVFFSFPAPAHATITPISFTNYSVIDTVIANGVANQQTLAGSTPQSSNLSQANTSGPGTSGTSSASIAAAVNPLVILNTLPVQSVSPSISLTQTLKYTPPAGAGSNDAIANSSFNAAFKGTGNVATFYINYFPGSLSGGFKSDLNLIVASGSTPVAYFYASNSLTGLAITNFIGGADSPPISGLLPGPFFLEFATQSGATYSIKGDMLTFIGGPVSGGVDTASFDLIANTPEPSTMALFGTGIVLMGFSALRKRNRLGNQWRSLS